MRRPLSTCACPLRNLRESYKSVSHHTTEESSPAVEGLSEGMRAVCSHGEATVMLSLLRIIACGLYGLLDALLRRCRLTANVLEGSTVLYPAEVSPSQREGGYEVSFKPEISGVYGLAVCLEGGRALKGSPFRVRAKTDETVAANCKMYGGGLTRAMAGQETSFTIQGQLPTGRVHGTSKARSCAIYLLLFSHLGKGVLGKANV